MVSGVSQFTLPIEVFGDGELGSLRFYLPTSAVSDWQETEAEAVELGGHLVWINSESEQEFIDQTFLGSAAEYWIGLANVADPADPVDFQWTSGATFGFSRFATSEPVGNGDFVYLQDQGNSTSQWFDAPGTTNRLGIIKLATLSQLSAAAFSTTSSGVTVNNVAPELTISGASSVDEGAQYALTLELLDDPGNETDIQFVVKGLSTSTRCAPSLSVAVATISYTPGSA